MEKEKSFSRVNLKIGHLLVILDWALRLNVRQYMLPVIAMFAIRGSLSLGEMYPLGEIGGSKAFIPSLD